MYYWFPDRRERKRECYGAIRDWHWVVLILELCGQWPVGHWVFTVGGRIVIFVLAWEDLRVVYQQHSWRGARCVCWQPVVQNVLYSSILALKILLVGVTDARANKGSRPTVASGLRHLGGGGGRRHMLSPNGTHFASSSWVLICRGKSPSQMVLIAKCLSQCC